MACGCGPGCRFVRYSRTDPEYRYDDVVGLDSTLPVTVACERNRAVNVAIAIDLTADLVVTRAGNDASDLAAFIDQRWRTCGAIAKSPCFGVVHAA